LVRRDTVRVERREARRSLRRPILELRRAANMPPKNIPRKVKLEVVENSVSVLLKVAWKVREDEREFMSRTSIASDAVQTPRARIIRYILEGQG